MLYKRLQPQEVAQMLIEQVSQAKTSSLGECPMEFEITAETENSVRYSCEKEYPYFGFMAIADKIIPKNGEKEKISLVIIPLDENDVAAEKFFNKVKKLFTSMIGEQLIA